MVCRGVLGCCLALAVPQLASAELPFANGTFGQLEGTLAFCAQVNPSAAMQYQEQGRLLVKGVAAKELAAARESAEYREAYDSMAAELGKISKDDAVKTCAGTVGSLQ